MLVMWSTYCNHVEDSRCGTQLLLLLLLLLLRNIKRIFMAILNYTDVFVVNVPDTSDVSYLELCAQIVLIWCDCGGAGPSGLENE